MPIIKDAELGEDFSQEPVAEGEYDLRIISKKYAVSDKGNAGLTLGFRIENQQDAPLVTVWLGEPIKGDENYKRRMREIQYILKTFGWGGGDFDMEHDGQRLIGQTGRCFLKQEVDKRDDSTVNRIRFPRGPAKE